MKRLLDFLFPRYCVSCRAWGSSLCDRCAKKLKAVAPTCPMCLRPSIDGSSHPRCRSRTSIDALQAAVSYAGPARQLIHRLKFTGVYDLTHVIVDLVLERAGAVHALPRNTIVLPIPLHPKRQRERGFNQAEKIARLLAERLALPIFPDILQRRRETEPQAQKSRKERVGAMDDVFAVTHAAALEQRTVLLVDDVWTTGATMRSAATALKRAGAGSVIGVVFARS